MVICVCNFFSCIVTRDLKVLWEPGVNSHETIISKHKLKDDKLVDRDFVRIELAPQGNEEKSGVFTRERKDWKYKVDEEGTLPAWYKASEARAEELVWKAALATLKPLEGLIFLANVTQEEAKAEALKRGGEILLNREVNALILEGMPDIGWIWTGTHVKYKGTDCTVTEHGKSTRIKLPESDGYYEPDKFGIPSGKRLDSSNPKARYLFRVSENECLLRRRDDWCGDYDRRYVGADDGPYFRCGVLIRVPRSSAAKTRKK